MANCNLATSGYEITSFTVFVLKLRIGSFDIGFRPNSLQVAE